MRITRFAAVLSVALTSLSIGLAAQGGGNIKTAPVTVTDASSGAEMYGAYCAVCHGRAGRGDGPAATELKTPPTDLTTLAKRHTGKFPGDYVTQVLQNGPATAKAHGSKEMPVWGPLFSAMGAAGTPSLRIYNLSKYLESMQAK